MDSHELIGRSGGNRWIPLVAVIQDDFRQIIRHWAFWIWAGLALVLPILWLLNASNITAATLASLLKNVGSHEVAKPTEPAKSARAEFEWNDPRKPDDGTHVAQKPQEGYVSYDQDQSARQRSQQIAARPYQDDSGQAQTGGRYRGIDADAPRGFASQFGGKLLGMHLLIWIALAMALGATAISSEFASIGESVMCWGVARWQYYFGKMASRCVAAMTLVVVMTLPMLFVFNAKMGADLAFWPSITTTLLCAAVVGCIVALGVSIGVWFRTSMRAVAVSLVSLLFVGVVCTYLGPTAYSPLEFVQSLPGALRGVEPAVESDVLRLFAWSAGGVGLLSFGKFVWADL